jgi:2-oxoglutarate ferredoxin oxidoreductase subunit alpha
MANYFEGYRFHVTGLNHGANGFPTTNPDYCHKDGVRMIRKVMSDVDNIVEYEEYMLDDAEIALFAFGSTARGARMAVEKARKEKIKVGLFRAITIWPFPDKQIRELSNRIKAIIVPEANLGQMINEVERVVMKDIPIIGVNRVGGVPIPPYEMLEQIKEVNKNA